MSDQMIITLLGKGLNTDGWASLLDLLDRRKLTYEIHQAHESIEKKSTLGIILNYSRVVSASVLGMARFGFVVFHSSDLPQGRGFAPIFNTIARKIPLTQTLCYAAKQVDSGNIIAKARYELHGNEMEDEVRFIDDQLTMLLIEDALAPLLGGQVTGTPQKHKNASWWPRRKPEDSVIDPNLPVMVLFDTLRALPSTAPAFFMYHGRKYFIHLKAETPVCPFDQSRLTLVRHYVY